MNRPPSAASPRPTPRRSPFLRFLTVAVLFCLAPIVVLGATVAATGTLVVSVEEHGPEGVSLWIPVPALLVDIAVFAVPRIVPAHEVAQIRRELEPFREAIEGMAEELEEIPAGSVILEVQDGPDHVKISKRWRSFEIAVDGPDTDVRVSVPARLLSRSLDLFG
ncbi:MAG: hypothetical protein AAF725_16635 [Acidobacteriota bacterium]